MKAFLCTNITAGKNSEMNGKEFIIKSVSQEINEELNNVNKKLENIEKKSNLSDPLYWVKFICEIYVLIFVGGLINALDTVTLSEGIKNAFWLFVLAIVALIVAVTLSIIEKKK